MHQLYTTMDSAASLLLVVSTLAVLLFTAIALLFQFGVRSSKLSIPRIGQTPGVLGNTSQGHFFNNSLRLIEDGYARVSIAASNLLHGQPSTPAHDVHSIKTPYICYGQLTWIA